MTGNTGSAYRPNSTANTLPSVTDRKPTPVYYAYFAPYSMERHADLVARIAARPGVALEVIGQTLDGQDLDMLTIGEPGDGKRVCWAIAASIRERPWPNGGWKASSTV